MDQSVYIETATEADFETIRNLAYDTWPHAFHGILSDDQIAYMLEMMYSASSLKEQIYERGHTFLLAAHAGAYVGFSSYEHHEPAQYTKIHKIYVLPPAQGKGIGRALIERVDTIARQNRSKMLCLNVNRNNPSIKFYERLGFVISGREDIAIGKGYFMEDFTMQKIL